MTDQRPQVSVVIALLDEAGTVEELVGRIRAALQQAALSFEIICIDDGSRDETAAILRRLEAGDGRLRIFELTRNFGQAAALACGLFAARGEVTITMDGDLQNPPEEIPKLVEALHGGADVVTARRAQRHEAFLRWLGSRAVHWLARRLTRAEIDDFGGNFKGYRRPALEATKRAWAAGKPFFPLALWLGYRVREVAVRHEPRRLGASRYTVWTLLRINFDLITSFTTLPLAAISALGGGFLAIGVVGAAICWWTAAGVLGTGLSLTLIGVGAVWLAAGVVGLYVGRTYQLVAGGGSPYVVRSGPKGEIAAARHVVDCG
jgi:undecaprenyl-phosphate 4-deoxy-4-formamido-L-arabinose transferase